MSGPVSFLDPRPVAQHCAELLNRGGNAQGQRSRLPDIGATLAKRLGVAIGRFLGGQTLRVRCEVSAANHADTTRASHDAAVRTWLQWPGMSGQVVFIVGRGALLSVTEQVFGGSGTSSSDSGEQGSDADGPLPLTARLVAAELCAIVAGELAASLGLSVPEHSDEPAVQRPARGHADAVHRTARFALSHADGSEWSIALGICPEAHDALFSDAPPAPGAVANRGGGMPGAAATVRLDLCAVLAELPLPLARVAQLRPGDLLPIAVPRTVTLKAGEQAIGVGSAGAVEGRSSLQLSHIF